MIFRHLALVTFALLLTACNFSLAEDVTPPPNYVPPTPMPTLGPLFPAEPPDIANGAALYAKHCANCHGERGMGDGDEGKRLPVSVTALALPQVGQAASPADWYAVVTRGNAARNMPSFEDLSDQERWDVIAYALTLHTSEKDLKRGQELYEYACADCPTEIFRDQEWMASLSDMELAQVLKDGTSGFPALGDKMTEGGFVELAFYVRTLSFAASTPTVKPVAVTTAKSPSITETAVPSAPEAAINQVTGSVRGKEVAGFTVTLRGFDHAADASGPQEILALTAVTDANGNYLFEGLEMPEGRIYITDVTYKGVTYSSDFEIVEAGMSQLLIPPLDLYETSDDLSSLIVNQWHIILDISDDTLQVIEFLSLTNPTGESIIVPVVSDTMSLVPLPQGVTSLGYDAQQGNAMPVTAEAGFALPPSDKAYGMLAGYKVPYDGKAEIVLPFSLEVPSGSLLVPPGIKVKGGGLLDAGQQDIGDGNVYQIFKFSNIHAGNALTVRLSGFPGSGGIFASASATRNLLIGLGSFGIALILAGAWMYRRERNERSRPAEETDEAEENGFESEADVLDAIIALDDLRRAGKINGEAYRARREELKSRLK